MINRNCRAFIRLVLPVLFGAINETDSSNGSSAREYPALPNNTRRWNPEKSYWFITVLMLTEHLRRFIANEAYILNIRLITLILGIKQIIVVDIRSQYFKVIQIPVNSR